MVEWLPFYERKPLFGNLIPTELVGKVVRDAFESRGGRFIEFECGTIVRVEYFRGLHSCETNGYSLSISQRYKSHRKRKSKS